jgi:ABC-type uncharacterized transport system substrate-binding protein
MMKGCFSKVFFAIFVSFTGIFAHPHMFIEWSASLSITQSGLQSIKVQWVFDEMNSALIVEDFDVNKDGVLSAAEQKTIFEEAFSYAAVDQFFIQIHVNQAKPKLPAIHDFKAQILPSGQLAYSFSLPYSISAKELLQGSLRLGFEDPNFYIGFFAAQGKTAYNNDSPYLVQEPKAPAENDQFIELKFEQL